MYLSSTANDFFVGQPTGCMTTDWDMGFISIGMTPENLGNKLVCILEGYFNLSCLKDGSSRGSKVRHYFSTFQQFPV